MTIKEPSHWSQSLPATGAVLAILASFEMLSKLELGTLISTRLPPVTVARVATMVAPGFEIEIVAVPASGVAGKVATILKLQFSSLRLIAVTEGSGVAGA